MAGAHLGTLPAFTNFILAATLGWETGAPAQGPTVLRLSLQCTDGETEGRTASKQNIPVSDSVLSPLPPELCGMSWLGALGPAGSFHDGWRCQHRGRVLGGNLEAAPTARAAATPLRKKCRRQMTPELPSSGFQHVGRTHHRCLKSFHISLAIRK